MNSKRRGLRGKWERLIADSRRQAVPETLPFPTEAQLDLLKAAMLPAAQAAPAWLRWKARGLTLDTVGDASFRLLGRLWTNREAAAIGTDDLALLKGIYRQSFADNVAKLTAAMEATQVLADAGIPVLFLKGAALIATCDDSLGQRRIADVDILVPEDQADRAAVVLTAVGYQATYGCSHRHSWHCAARPGYDIDLHWWAFKPAGDDSVLFETAQEARLLGRTVLVPSATESLLVVVANGFWGSGTPLRWIADSLLLFQTSTVDWDVVLQRSKRPGLLPGLTAGLEYLAHEFGAPVPASVLDELRRQPVPWQSRLAYRGVTSGNFPDWTPWEVYRAHRLHYQGGRSSRDRPSLAIRAAVRSIALLALRQVNRLAARTKSRRAEPPGLR